jgi:hypothetical protein
MICNLGNLFINLLLDLLELDFPEFHAQLLVFLMVEADLVRKLLNLYLFLRPYVSHPAHLVPNNKKLALQIFDLIHALELQVLAHQCE